MVGTIGIAEEASKNKTDKNPCLGGAYILAREADNQGNIRERIQNSWVRNIEKGEGKPRL